MKIYRDIIQGTPEWFNLRAGIVTMSNLDQIIQPVKMQPSASAEKYMNRLLAELFYGHPLDTFQSAAMQNGIDGEAEAAHTYDLLNSGALYPDDAIVEKIGFVMNDAGTAGCSPDRFITREEKTLRGLEIKVPEPHTHVAYLRTKAVERDYWCQLQGILWICELDVIDIFSYNRKMPHVQMEVGRDEKFIGLAAIYVKEFNERFAKERARYGLPDRIVTVKTEEETTTL